MFPMKTLFTLFLSVILCSQAQAQLSDSVKYKPLVIFYSSEYQVTKKEFAAYARVAYFPGDLNAIDDLKRPLFNGPVKDFYADGGQWAVGNYQNGVPHGAWSFYYPNGQLECQGSFKDIWPDGKWEFWWPNGQPLLVAEYSGYDMRVLSSWNEQGEQMVKDGNGIYTAYITGKEGEQLKIEGAYKDGSKFGRWICETLNGKVLLEQTFGEGGSMQGGISYMGKRKQTFTTNKFLLNPEPTHLPAISVWSNDAKAYASNYPVFAEMMGAEVRKIELAKSKQTSGSHYYKIIQKHNAVTDTLEYGYPVVMPVFAKGMQDYIHRKLVFPRQLYDRNLEGTIVVQFTVKADGTVQNPAILKGVHQLLDQQVLKMLREMPNWKPATKKGKTIDATINYSIAVMGKTFRTTKPDFERGSIPDMDSRKRTF